MISSEYTKYLAKIIRTPIRHKRIGAFGLAIVLITYYFSPGTVLKAIEINILRIWNIITYCIAWPLVTIIREFANHMLHKS